MTATSAPIRVGIETTPRTVFASALDWPGWSRAGRTESDALGALAAAHERFAEVARSAGAGEPSDGPYVVVQTLPGDATTAFGAPSVVFEADRDPVDAAGGERLAALVEAARAALDRIAASAPAELRKGPRGGGRDRDKVLEHVAGAHQGYVRPLGARPERGATDAARRAAMLARLRLPWDGTPSAAATWPPRYARAGWRGTPWTMPGRSRTDRTPERPPSRPMTLARRRGRAQHRTVRTCRLPVPRSERPPPPPEACDATCDGTRRAHGHAAPCRRPVVRDRRHEPAGARLDRQPSAHRHQGIPRGLVRLRLG